MINDILIKHWQPIAPPEMLSIKELPSRAPKRLLRANVRVMTYTRNSVWLQYVMYDPSLGNPNYQSKMRVRNS